MDLLIDHRQIEVILILNKVALRTDYRKPTRITRLEVLAQSSIVDLEICRWLTVCNRANNSPCFLIKLKLKSQHFFLIFKLLFVCLIRKRKGEIQYGEQ